MAQACSEREGNSDERIPPTTSITHSNTINPLGTHLRTRLPAVDPERGLGFCPWPPASTAWPRPTEARRLMGGAVAERFLGGAVAERFLAGEAGPGESRVFCHENGFR